MSLSSQQDQLQQNQLQQDQLQRNQLQQNQPQQLRQKLNRRRRRYYRQMRKLIKNEDRNLNSAMGQAMGDVMRSLGHTLERIGSLDMSGEDRRLLEEELEWGFQNRFMKEFYNIVPLSVDSHIRTNKSLQRLLFATLVTERLMRKKDWSALYKIRPILEEKFAIVKSAPNSPIRLNRRFTLVDLRDLVRLQKYSLRKRPEAQNNRPWWS